MSPHQFISLSLLFRTSVIIPSVCGFLQLHSLTVCCVWQRPWRSRTWNRLSRSRRSVPCLTVHVHCNSSTQLHWLLATVNTLQDQFSITLTVKPIQIVKLSRWCGACRDFGVDVLPVVWGLTSTPGAAVAQSVQCLNTDWTTGVRFPAGAEDFSYTLCIQTSFGAHPAPIQWVGDPFLGSKALPVHDADHSRSLMSRSYISSPPKPLHGV
jgi:hypothetical protein